MQLFVALVLIVVLCQHESSSSMAQNPPFHATSDAISTTVERGVQNGKNNPELSDIQGENAHVKGAVRRGISLHQGHSAIYSPKHGTPDIPMIPWSQENPQGDQLGQFSLPSIEYNSSAIVNIKQESLSTILESQQQSYVQQPDQKPHISNTLASISIIVQAKSNSTRRRSAVLLNNFLQQGQAEVLKKHQCDQGLSLGSSSKNPGVLFISTSPNAREIDLSSWVLASPSKQVALSKNGDFQLVTEITNSRVLTFWFESSKAGKFEMVTNLSERPDNIKRNQQGEFWVEILKAGNGKRWWYGSDVDEENGNFWIVSVIESHAVKLEVSN
ncbi:hypothetical protein ACH5RR_021737 [Cinchona calisaya]|uniref:Uncharacterized protein n=1 Tax=Cinchona calisaya TaxID=153742 RepID=A0ABD2ZIF7_9GENT